MKKTKITVLFLVLFGAWSVESFAKEVCYENGIGCFSDDPPWNSMPLPKSPAEIGPTYTLHQKDKPPRVVATSSEIVNVYNLVVIVHGLVDNFNQTIAWSTKIISRIHQVRLDAEVIFVDWSRGSRLVGGVWIYHQPATNTRLIAQMLSLWLKANPKFDSTKAHCIGYSLGSHVCGLTAKRMGTKWGRLSALDPAGPCFMTDDIRTRVDKSDGIVVDAMHISWVALKRPVGHKDFYVNSANIQPGCIARELERFPSLSNITAVVGGFFTCSHVRTVHLFAETIVPMKNCTFQFCPCASMEEYEKGKCKTCDPSVGALLGYRSIESANTGSFYGATTGKEPFCLQSN